MRISVTQRYTSLENTALATNLQRFTLTCGREERF